MKKYIHLLQKSKPYIFIAPAIFMLLVFTVYPILYLIYLSFFKGGLISKTKPFVGLNNYVELFQMPEFIKVLFNTAMYSVLLVVGVLVLATLFAVWLNPKKGSKLNSIVQASIFTPHIISLVSVSMIFLWLMDTNVGLFNSILTNLGLPKQPFLDSDKTALISLVGIMIWKSVGYYTLIIMGALRSIPDSLYEAAELDNANPITVFFKITLPMISPTLLFTSVVATIGSFKVFDTIAVMTQGGPINSTNTLVYFIYEYAFKYGKMGLACAAGVILLLFVIILTMVQFGVGKRKVHYQ